MKTTNKKGREATTRTYIEGEINSLNRYGSGSRYRAKPEPHEVKAARNRVTRWEQGEALRRKAFQLQAAKAMADMRRAFYTFEPLPKVIRMMDVYKRKFVDNREEE